MKQLKFWHVDSFTTTPFQGNPAAVFIHEGPLDANLMQNIAMELNLSETAFIQIRKNKRPLLRWFTPVYEIDLCGHATLAAAQIYFTHFSPTAVTVTFDTRYVGPLTIKKNDTSLTMQFPIRSGDEMSIDHIPNFVLESLSDQRPVYARKARDLMLVYEDEKTVLEMTPNFNTLLDYESFVIVTAPSSDPEYDFISRFFCPSDGILEDPVTGSAHCTLAPYWSKRLGQKTMTAFQASKRGGILFLDLEKEHLNITGNAIIIAEGTLNV